MESNPTETATDRKCFLMEVGKMDARCQTSDWRSYCLKSPSAGGALRWKLICPPFIPMNKKIRPELKINNSNSRFSIVSPQVIPLDLINC